MKTFLAIIIALVSITFKVFGQCNCTSMGPELVANGDFSQGNIGFSTVYTYTNMALPSNYGITTNSQNNNGPPPPVTGPYWWSACHDHTSGNGNFMWVDADSLSYGLSMWGETFPVTPNTNYVFSFWFTNVNNMGNPPGTVQFSINGQFQGPLMTASQTPCNWLNKCVTWNSGNSTIANISIINMAAFFIGNDFGFDDISFRKCNTCVNPSANITSTPTLCGGNTGTAAVIPSGGIAPYTYNWSPTGANSPAISGLAPGTYSVTVADATGCSSMASVVVKASNGPVAALTPTSPCLGSAASLADGSVSVAGDPIVSWNWIMPGGNPVSSNNQNASTVYGTGGTHTVSLVVTSQNGCTDTISQQVLVYDPPVANFVAPLQGCAPVCNTYTDLSTCSDGNITNWQWTFPGGSTTSTTGKNPQTICYTTPGTYNASLMVTSSYGCKDTITLPAVVVYPWPKADFCVAPAVAPATDPVFHFCDQWSSDVVQWSWNFGDNDSDKVNTDPNHTYVATLLNNDFYTYNICLRVENQYGCWDTICKPVELVPEFTFYIPNTFTPNGDNTNELFFSKCRGVKEYNIWLFDRWGNQIWDCHKEDENINWDGQGQDGLASDCKWDGVVQKGGLDMSGNSRQLTQQDVYVWKVKLTDIFNKQHSYVGNVNVVK